MPILISADELARRIDDERAGRAAVRTVVLDVRWTLAEPDGRPGVPRRAHPRRRLRRPRSRPRRPRRDGAGAASAAVGGGLHRGDAPVGAARRRRRGGHGRPREPVVRAGVVAAAARGVRRRADARRCARGLGRGGASARDRRDGGRTRRRDGALRGDAGDRRRRGGGVPGRGRAPRRPGGGALPRRGRADRSSGGARAGRAVRADRREPRRRRPLPPPEALREPVRRRWASSRARRVAAYCGSGVTAAHEVAALALAGIDARSTPVRGASGRTRRAGRSPWVPSRAAAASGRCAPSVSGGLTRAVNRRSRDSGAAGEFEELEDVDRSRRRASGADGPRASPAARRRTPPP